LNKVVLPDGPGVGTSELIPLVPDPKRLDREYLGFYLRSPGFVRFATSVMQGANLPRVSMTEFWSHRLTLPSLERQRHVVARIKECLSRVEEMQRLREEVLEEAWSLLDALINELLSEADGTPVRLGEVVIIASALVDPRLPQHQELLHIGGANIVSGTGELLNLKTAADEKLVSGKYLFTPKDVIYSKIRPKLRKVVRPDFSGLCRADSYPLRPIEGRLNRDFLFYLLLSRKLTGYAVGGSNRAGIPKVNREHLLAFEFDLPKPKVQERIAATLNKSWNAAKQIASELTETGEDYAALRESILREAFAGNL
jgi:type I restriction enzyme S subunit